MTLLTSSASDPVASAPAPAEPVAPRSLPGLSVILPCFNEEANVSAAIRAAMAAAARTSLDYEILVVDDGSSDDTARVASSFVGEISRVRLLVHPHNRGYGAALSTGIRAAWMPWVLITDSDLQFDLDDLDQFAALADSADVVAGRRSPRCDPPLRRMNGAAWSWLVRSLFHLPVHDVDCAFKLIRRELLDGLELSSSGAMISTELLVKCRAQGARILEQDVRHRHRPAGDQSGARVGVVVRAFRELAAQQTGLRRLSRQAPPERGPRASFGQGLPS